ncbi:uncharacterized protein DNG_03990 [Cephalotrichum gorgonifer]|uniref:Uncharacterized protein n=1 Tax=Cephalotrichum gorgonifer TaxID=2041049 RepID=A0AAE8SU41_9PEZI|nr:uncharacterized protein DNG_03990 [Cephalotrichum gorgonifer]
MRFGTGALLSLALASRGAWADIPLRAWVNNADPAEMIRLWYGDGLLYAGSRAPKNVETVVDITFNEARRGLLFIKTDDDASSPTLEILDDPTFLAIDVRPGASNPVRLLHSAVGLTHEDIFLFMGIEGYWYPYSREGAPAGGLFLIPTEGGEEDASVLRWFVNPAEAEELGGKAVTLATRGSED